MWRCAMSSLGSLRKMFCFQPHVSGFAAIREDALKLVQTAIGARLGTSALQAVSVAIIEALMPAAVAPTVDASIGRAACLSVVAAAGAQPNASCSTTGRLITGSPASSLMPTR